MKDVQSAAASTAIDDAMQHGFIGCNCLTYIYKDFINRTCQWVSVVYATHVLQCANSQGVRYPSETYLTTRIGVHSIFGPGMPAVAVVVAPVTGHSVVDTESALHQQTGGAQVYHARSYSVAGCGARRLHKLDLLTNSKSRLLCVDHQAEFVGIRTGDKPMPGV